MLVGPKIIIIIIVIILLLLIVVHDLCPCLCNVDVEMPAIDFNNLFLTVCVLHTCGYLCKIVETAVLTVIAGVLSYVSYVSVCLLSISAYSVYLFHVPACTVNAFKARLDKFWQHQAVKFDFTADLTVPETDKRKS